MSDNTPTAVGGTAVIVPPYMRDRHPDAVLKIVIGLDVANNFAFLPHKRIILGSTTGPLTMCNTYLNSFTVALGCAIPPLLANQQVKWLAGPEGVEAGWAPCDKAEALRQANFGYPVVAVVGNPEGHGHCAVVVRSPSTDSANIYVSSAGIQNFGRTKLEHSFGSLQPLFYRHA